jgi:chloride channel protein, CIC family
LVSQAVSRKLNRENFYEALLTYDGHRIEHVRPPRNLQGWQQLPVSAIANFRPVMLESLERAEMQGVLKSHPYQRFPVVKEGKLVGILTRREGEAAITENRLPKLQPATTCLPDQTVRELQGLLIESSTQFVVLSGSRDGAVLGLLTLHDLLRAEVEKAKSGDD